MRIYSEQEIDELASILKQDGTLAVATDTVYGVCARLSERACMNLRLVKNRPSTKAFPIMCSDVEQISSIAEVDERSRRIIETFMPGPLTVVLRKKKEVAEYVNGGMDTLAIRMASSPAIKALIEKAGSPLFMTSANQSGEHTADTIEEIQEACPLLSAIMDGRPQYGEASTIVDCSGEELRILREGPITLEQLEHAGRESVQ